MLELEGEAEWSQEGPTLSNDIWKKFQLIPTPPRSPSHEADLRHSDHTDLPSLGLMEDLVPLPPLELPSLIEDHDFGLALENIDLFPEHLPDCGGPAGHGAPGGVPCAHGTCTSCTQLALAGSELRHDCMWRGTCTAEAHTYHPRDLHHHHHHSHRDSAAHLPELLMDTASALECAAGFTRLHDLHDDDEDDDDTLDDMEVEDDLAARPDTPSESSETDTDEEDQEDEEPDDHDAAAAPPAVHVDHSYHCPRAPSPRHAYAPAMPHTPSESEDEIDVVSVGSPDSAYSSSSSRSTAPSTRVGGEKRKRGAAGSRNSGGDPTSIHPSSPTPAIPATTTPALPTAATTTFVTTTGMKKVVKIRTSNLPSSSSKSRHRRSSGGGGGGVSSTSSKRRTTSSTSSTDSCSSSSSSSPSHHTSSTTVTSIRRTTTTTTTSSPHNTTYSKSVKRIRNHHHSHTHHSRKRRGNKGEGDDPERRHLHNSLERMRRVDLRNAFEELRVLVPGLCDKDKAPKVEILRKASEHCYSVTQRGRLLEQEKERQKRLQGELKKRLASLQRRN